MGHQINTKCKRVLLPQKTMLIDRDSVLRASGQRSKQTVCLRDRFLRAGPFAMSPYFEIGSVANFSLIQLADVQTYVLLIDVLL